MTIRFLNTIKSIRKNKLAIHRIGKKRAITDKTGETEGGKKPEIIDEINNNPNK